MSLSECAELLGPALFAAIERKGYADLTAVQRAVLDPALASRDLRITSQTGSGKTLAIGLTLRELVGREAAGERGVARPYAIVVAPTRELAHQVEQELGWLYEDTGVQLATTTGGASYRDEHRALSRSPAIVVGTPGRLLDHLKRGSIDAGEVETVVLDEADRMLDLGFREDLESLFERVPKTRRTHLVSATFPRMVRSLADKLQRDPAHVEGTRLGAANADIDHVIHVVDPAQRLDALVNLLLANPEDQTLVFVRTRADAAHVANELVVTGFAASALSGEMEQAARNRALAAFKTGGLRVLVATDVAARGIDVQGVTRVVHGELPTNADAYTHRAGRTGRAGRKGTSSLLVAPVGVVRASRLLRDLGVDHRFEPIPSAEEIVRAADEQVFEELTAEAESTTAEGEPVDVELSRDDARWRALAARLLEAGELERTLVRLLKRARRSVTEPRNVRVFPVRQRPERLDPQRAQRYDRAERHKSAKRSERTAKLEHAEQYKERYKRARTHERAAGDDYAEPLERAEPLAHAEPHEAAAHSERAARDEHAKPFTHADGHKHAERSERAEHLKLAERHERAPKYDHAQPHDGPERHARAGRATRARNEGSRSPQSTKQKTKAAARAEKRAADALEFKSFHVSWGERDGADARRLLAMVCRRGKIRGRDVGAIRVESSYSLIQVANSVAASFAKAASRPDPREPNIFIRPDRAQPGGGDRPIKRR
jgi:ATP-dependent RNA helicase DeaD